VHHLPFNRYLRKAVFSWKKSRAKSFPYIMAHHKLSLPTINSLIFEKTDFGISVFMSLDSVLRRLKDIISWICIVRGFLA